MSHPNYKERGDPLGKFVEECGEVLAAAGKTIRFGWDSVNPELPLQNRETNEDWLRREIGDLKEAIARLETERRWVSR